MAFNTVGDIQTQILEALNLTTAQHGTTVLNKIDDANLEIAKKRDWWFYTIQGAMDTVTGLESYGIAPSTPVAVTMVGNTATLTTLINGVYTCSGAMTGAGTLIIPTGTSQVFTVVNSTTGGFAITVKTATGTGVSVSNGSTVTMASNGSDAIASSTNGNILPGTLDRFVVFWYELSGIKYPLYVDTELSFRQNYYGLQTIRGYPQMARILQDQTLQVFPLPSGTYKIGFYYTKRPTTITGTGDSIEIPARHREILYWAAFKKVAEYYALTNNERYPMAIAQYKQFLKDMMNDANQTVIDDDIFSIKRNNKLPSVINTQVLLYTP